MRAACPPSKQGDLHIVAVDEEGDLRKACPLNKVVYEICALLSCWAACSGNYLRTFRDKFSVVLSSRTLEGSTDSCPEMSVRDFLKMGPIVVLKRRYFLEDRSDSWPKISARNFFEDGTDSCLET